MLRPLALTVIASLALPAMSAAQFGNILKKGKDKAAKEAAKAAGVTPTEGTLKFDNVMLELTPPVVERMEAGLKARAAAKDSKGRTASELRRQSQAAADEAAKLNLNRDNDRREYDNKKQAADNCVSEFQSVLKQQQSDALQKKIMGMTGANLEGMQSANAKFMQELNAAQVEMGAAQSSGDTARIRKAEERYNKAMGLDPKADSAKARAKCNVPVPPPWMARADSLDAESTKLLNESRDVEAKGNIEGVKVSAMTEEQFAMAWERILGWLQGADGSLKYSSTEHKALAARRSQLQALVS